MTEENGNQENGQAADWKASLSEDYRGDKALAPFKSPDDLAKSYINLSKKLGQNTVVVPGKDATDYDREQFAVKALGRPETKDGYKLKAPDGVAGERIDRFRDLAFDAGLSNDRAQKIVDEWLGYETNSAKTAAEEAKVKQEADRKEAHEALRKEWGTANYDRNVTLARRAIADIAGESFQKYLADTGLGDDPAMLKAWAEVARKISGDSAGGHKDGEVRTRADAQNEYNRLLGEMAKDKNHPLRDRGHPEHTAMQKRFSQLTQEITAR